MLEAVHIAANKNTVPGDVSAMVPGGIRMGKASHASSTPFLAPLNVQLPGIKHF